MQSYRLTRHGKLVKVVWIDLTNKAVECHHRLYDPAAILLVLVFRSKEAAFARHTRDREAARCPSTAQPNNSSWKLSKCSRHNSIGLTRPWRPFAVVRSRHSSGPKQ